VILNRTIMNPKLAIWFKELRAPFFTASIIPVLVGTSIAYSTANVFDHALFILAVIGMVALHAGANIANDYFDHTSGNDWLNKNVTPFSGGSQFIQQGLLSPQSVLIAAWVALSIGILIGIMIIFLTKSFFILAIGLIGLLGGYFYTASPVRLGYRGAGELVIGMLFGILPVYGSYYLQTRTIDFVPVVPGLIVAMLIFLVILINEFPDCIADSAVNKKTLVVIFGDIVAAWIYRIVLLATFCIAIVVMLVFEIMRLPGLFYLATFPLAFLTLKHLRHDVLQESSKHTANKLTILFHLVGGLMLSLGFLLSNLMDN
jgi:1,4-dihydroxy-2-naphthoate octaprenyltransferase